MGLSRNNAVEESEWLMDNHHYQNLDENSAEPPINNINDNLDDKDDNDEDDRGFNTDLPQQVALGRFVVAATPMAAETKNQQHHELEELASPGIIMNN